MAESVTYADLRFVKAPLKKRLSSQLGQDPEADDDGELTYENVQVPAASGGASNSAPSGLGDKAGEQSEPPPAPWGSLTSPAAWRLPGGRRTCWKSVLVGLLLACLLLGMAAVSLGVRYLQASQQRQQASRALEATNSSLRQQLRLQTTQLGQREQDLQGCRRELAQSREALQVEQRDCQAVKEQSEARLKGWEETKEALRSEEGQRRTLEERLNRMQDTLNRMRPFFVRDSLKSWNHGSPDTRCPVGWILMERNCFYISLIKRSWEESQSYCKSLSSNLATIMGYYYSSSIRKLLEEVDPSDSYWVDYRRKDLQETDSRRPVGHHAQNQKCTTVQKWIYSQKECTAPLPCICEMASFMFPHDH